MSGRFRLLRADEIDCRIGMIKDNGLSLLLYKDARCDMAILDETFGPFGWQRHHSRDNANCIVSIFDSAREEWVEKEDVGTESNTEAIKGLASDSFKRACVNWGIGRELYTAPFIWVPATLCGIKGNKCYDRFSVAEIGYDDGGNINKLVIKNDSLKVVAFTYPPKKAKEASTEPEPVPARKEPEHFICADCGNEIEPWVVNGKTKMPVRAIVTLSENKYGRRLCLDCGTKAKEREMKKDA